MRAHNHCRVLLTGLVLALATRAVRAGDVYVAASVGQSTDNYTDSGGRSENVRAWKADWGLRYSRFLGTELEYIDYGTSKFDAPGRGKLFAVSLVEGPINGTIRTQGFAARQMGFLPVGSFVELFAGLGLQWSREVVNDTAHCLFDNNCIVTEHLKEYSWGLTGGVGVQVKLSAVRVKVEYESAAGLFGHPGLAPLGNPSIYSIGVGVQF
jgi:hypothetical protein